MPAFWIGHTPLIEIQHQLGMDHVQKPSESLTRMSTPLPETPTLTMPDDEAIHEEYHVPMTAYRLVATHLILCFGYRVARVEPQIVFPMQIELVYLVTETPEKSRRKIPTSMILIRFLFFTSNQLFFLLPKSVTFSSNIEHGGMMQQTLIGGQFEEKG